MRASCAQALEKSAIAYEVVVNTNGERAIQFIDDIESRSGVCRQKGMHITHAAFAQEISNPSFNSSPWMRGAPQGFSRAMVWMAVRTSRAVIGLPTSLL